MHTYTNKKVCKDEYVFGEEFKIEVVYFPTKKIVFLPFLSRCPDCGVRWGGSKTHSPEGEGEYWTIDIDIHTVHIHFSMGAAARNTGSLAGRCAMGGGGSKEEGGRKEGRKEGEKCHLLFPLPSLAHTGEERKEELPPSPAGITIDGRSTYMHYVDHSLLSSQCETCQKILAQVGKSSKWSHKESSSSSSSVLAPFLLGRGRYYYFSPGFYGREG